MITCAGVSKPPASLAALVYEALANYTGSRWTGRTANPDKAVLAFYVCTCGVRWPSPDCCSPPMANARALTSLPDHAPVEYFVELELKQHDAVPDGYLTNS